MYSEAAVSGPERKKKNEGKDFFVDSEESSFRFFVLLFGGNGGSFLFVNYIYYINLY